MYAEHPLSHQQVGHQDGHDNEEHNPEDVGHFWEDQQATAFIVVAKDTVISKFPSGHRHGLHEGEANILKGGSIGMHGSIILLQWIEKLE